jgi:hypothetical protein
MQVWLSSLFVGLSGVVQLYGRNLSVFVRGRVAISSLIECRRHLGK